MQGSIVVRKLGKQFTRKGMDRPSSLKETVIRRSRDTRPDRFWGLRDISFTVPPGRTVGVIGENGAGKSTLLRLIGGVGRPDEGSVQANGRIGALLDLGAGFSDDLTGRENVYVAGVIAGMTRAEVTAHFDDIVAFAELEKFIESPIRTFSTGMRMRLAFAVAAHIDPEILLIDEVLAVGDLAFQRKCLERIAGFKADGCTIFLVSHDSAQIRELCDEVILLRRGRMIAYGPTEPVLEQYESAMGALSAALTPNDVPGVDLPGVGRLEFNVNRFGSQELQITAVRLLGPEGDPVCVIPSGSGLVIEFDFATKQRIPSPIASVGIHLPSGDACYDTNTAVAKQELPDLDGEGTLRLRIDRLDLAGAQYFVTIGLYERDWAYSYDYHWLVYPLWIMGPNSGKGFLNPPALWDISVAPLDETHRAFKLVRTG
jgi:lipopolysaccharide transport system ATP-binding protein